MDTLKRLSKVYEKSKKIPFDDLSKIVLMSDCHRGDGNWADDFCKNQNLYFAALTHYYNENYTYIELGDGDELWENKRFDDIIQAHSDVFQLLSEFYNSNRLYFIFGNHDVVKKNKTFVMNNLYQYYDEHEKKFVPLFKNIMLNEGIVLKHKLTKDEILLIHGHQVDFMNDRMWRVNRFLTGYLWRPLESFGVNDPTRTAKNYVKKDLVEKRLARWVKKEKHMLIAGHTHRPMFPEVGEVPYFNDGSCVHPHSITAIEITQGNIILIRWKIKTRNDGTMYIGRDILAGPRKLKDYFNMLK